MNPKLLSFLLAAALAHGLLGSASEAAPKEDPPSAVGREVVARSRPAERVVPTAARVRDLPRGVVVTSRDITSPEPADRDREPLTPSVVAPRRASGVSRTVDAVSLGHSPAPASSFPGAHLDDSGRIPPDAACAVGRGHVMLLHNGVMQIRDKTTGAVRKTTTLASFFSPAALPGLGTVAPFDPRLHFDPSGPGGGRWIASCAADRNTTWSAVLVAVSRTSDPTGEWSYYRMDPETGSADLWYDFPILGYNDDWIVVRSAVPDTLKHTYVLPKAAAYAGGPVAPQLLEDREDVLAPCASLDASPGVAYLVGGGADLYALTGPPDGPFTLERLGHVQPPAGTSEWANGSQPLPQLGTSTGIAAGNAWPNTAILRNGSIWYAHTAYLPAEAPRRAAAQWWEIDPVAIRAVQLGRVEDPSEGPGARSFAFPAIAVNARGDAILGYTVFSRDQYAGAGYSFRLAGDPPGAMREPALLKAGFGPYVLIRTSGNRWGDYSGAAADPASDDLWVLLEYSATTTRHAWGTWWGRVRVADDTALSFRAADQGLRADDSASVSPVGPMTVEAWIRRARKPGKGNQVVLSKRGGGGFELRVNAKSGRAMVSIFDATGKLAAKATSSIGAAPERWSHVAGWYDGATLSVSVDGAVTSAPVPSPPGDGPGPLEIGRAADGTGSFRGAVDEVRLSSIARYAGAFVPVRGFANDPFTLGLWKLDDGPGSRTAVDASGNGNTAAVTGSPTWVPGLTSGATRSAEQSTVR